MRYVTIEAVTALIMLVISVLIMFCLLSHMVFIPPFLHNKSTGDLLRCFVISFSYRVPQPESVRKEDVQ